jgi:hypothetical protein
MKFPRYVEFETGNPRQAILSAMIKQMGEFFGV